MHSVIETNHIKDVSEKITFKKDVFSTPGKSSIKCFRSSIKCHWNKYRLNINEINEQENTEFTKSKASKLIPEGNIALIKTGN